MLRVRVAAQIRGAVERAFGLETARELPIEVTESKQAEHGDFSCNVAMQAAKALGLPPRVIADAVAEGLGSSSDFDQIEVAGPGFLNLFLSTVPLIEEVKEILNSGIAYRSVDVGRGMRVNVEFVSANPNGPVHLGHARGAAFGETLCRVLSCAGFSVHREHYINDALNSEQMRLFALSVQAICEERPLPEGGYQGDYVKAVAKALKRAGIPNDADLSWFWSQSEALMIQRQRSDLEQFGVRFDSWFSERSLHDSGAVAAALEKLVKQGAADREPYSWERSDRAGSVGLEKIEQPPGPLWLRATRFGDDKDRILLRTDGRPAYIAGDAAYLESKLGSSEFGGRDFTRAILIVGPDHHGYVARMMAVAKALGFKEDRFEIVIYQIVRFIKDGKPAPMRKRDGNIFALIDLIREIGDLANPNGTPKQRLQTGSDVSRFFYLSRSHDTHMDFDIDLATRQSDENPVFYVQYAHARICSLIEKAGAEFDGFEAIAADLGPLGHANERGLIKKIAELPHEVERAATDYGVHRLTSYSVELARTFHRFYDTCKVIDQKDRKTSEARMALCVAAKTALASALDLLGVSAPHRLESVQPDISKYETRAQKSSHEAPSR